MNRKELIEKIAIETEQTKKVVDAVLRALTTSIEEEVRAGGAVQLTGFATFKRVSVEECTKTSPRDKNVKVVIPAHHKMKVSITQRLKKFD